MSRARAADWNRLAHPEQRELLAFHAEFDSAELAQISQGLVPQAMEDKWFIYLDEDDWLYFHRSWTGACIYAVQLLRSAEGARVGTPGSVAILRNTAAPTATLICICCVFSSTPCCSDAMRPSPTEKECLDARNPLSDLQPAAGCPPGAW